MFRRTPTNLAKLRKIAAELGAVVMAPYYPASGLYRLIRDRDGLQFDFRSKVDGIRSFDGLKRRSEECGSAGTPCGWRAWQT